MKEIQTLLDIMVALRHPETGCPWDKKQNFGSISAYTIEEAYEVADAIERNALCDLKDELGDLLFQVVFHARLAQEQEEFEFRDVVNAINDKMIRRHPHVFTDVVEKDAAQLMLDWEAHKRSERDRAAPLATSVKSELDGIASTLPALCWAEKIQKRASAAGFDWQTLAPVLNKLDEEICELKDEIKANADLVRTEEELGDVLFSCVNLARHLNINPEQALRKANHKFIARFKSIEQQLQATNKSMADCELKELEAYWEKAKTMIHCGNAEAQEI